MTLFTIENKEFGWDEVVTAAEVWGEWQPFVETARQSLACLRLGAKSKQLPHASETSEAATTFRYAHNLISAEETRAWLDRWEMSVEDWMTFFRAQLLRRRWEDQLAEIVTAHPVTDAEVGEVIRNHAVCAGKLGEWAVRLAKRAAVAAGSISLDAGFESPRDLVGIIETEFERRRQQAITPRLIETAISHNRLDWIHFDCRYLWLAEERVAREAAWCVSEDGLTLDEVASEAHGEVRQWSSYADEIEASVRPYFLAARQGDLLGPLQMQEGFPLFSLEKKRMPSAADPRIHERAEQVILASFMDNAMNERVQWLAL